MHAWSLLAPTYRREMPSRASCDALVNLLPVRFMITTTRRLPTRNRGHLPSLEPSSSRSRGLLSSVRSGAGRCGINHFRPCPYNGSNFSATKIRQHRTAPVSTFESFPFQHLHPISVECLSRHSAAVPHHAVYQPPLAASDGVITLLRALRPNPSAILSQACIP